MRDLSKEVRFLNKTPFIFTENIVTRIIEICRNRLQETSDARIFKEEVTITFSNNSELVVDSEKSLFDYENGKKNNIKEISISFYFGTIQIVNPLEKYISIKLCKNDHSTIQLMAWSTNQRWNR